MDCEQLQQETANRFNNAFGNSDDLSSETETIFYEKYTLLLQLAES